MNQQKPLSRSNRAIISGIVLLFVFSFGLGIGNGSITAGRLSEIVRVDSRNINDSLPDNLTYDSVEQVYDELRKHYDGELKTSELLDGLKSGLAGATGDPHTEYMNTEAAEAFNQQLDGKFSGIGAELSKDTEGNIVVVAPISGYPAEKAGVRPKDVIVEVDGARLYGLTVNDAVMKIRGEVGTKVTLKIVRNQTEVIELEITREQITIPSVESELLDDSIGLITISRFGDDTAGLAHRAATDLKAQGATRIILDLRGNPGGTVTASVEVASLWLDKDAVVLQEKRGDEVVETYRANGNSVLKGVSTVVLIDEGSASASEIVAGALRDNGAATIIGQKSYGKGSVQRVIKLGDGSILKVTIARWFTPNDDTIDKEGLVPDKEVKLSEEDITRERDPQLDAAKKELAP